MDAVDVLRDGFERVRTVVATVLDGITTDELEARLDPGANSVTWLIWHLTRVQDDHVARAAGTEQVWTAQGWYDRFQVPVDRRSIGYGDSSDDVALLTGVRAELLKAYYGEVHASTTRFLDSLQDGDLDRVVDRAWDPPVTLGVRLVSVISDDLQHAGQAAFIRGVVRRTKQRAQP